MTVFREYVFYSGLVTLATVLAVSSYFVYHSLVVEEDKKEGKTKNADEQKTGDSSSPAAAVVTAAPAMKIPVRILYGTQTGTAKGFAQSLNRSIFALNIAGYHFDTSILNIKDYDVDNLEQETVVIFIMSTWTDGVPPADARIFCNWLKDMATDFRVSKTWLDSTHSAVFGLGNSEYILHKHYCSAAQELAKHLHLLGSIPLLSYGEETDDRGDLCLVGRGDDMQDQQQQFEQWSDQLLASLCTLYSSSSNNNTLENSQQQALEKTGLLLESSKPGRLSTKEWRRRQKKEASKVSGEPEAEYEDGLNDYLLESADAPEVMAAEAKAESKESAAPGVLDVEDMGAMLKSSADKSESEAPREMITPLQRQSLTKEGYKLIGTHSAVKLCRWTKHQLRGRGGCYKHTFYGITSYQCMETTPSLACANKCVFCWRHHKNPVGRTWRWKVDDAKDIVDASIAKHQKMIKELKGLPGLIPERWEAAFTVKHCALSLVGEPIMYPQINSFLRLLHQQQISSFLVTNAQFPDKIAELEPITQLYVSIDAATKDTLKAVDRPLFQDFWERFLSCLQQLKAKGQRTVYRLTLVKSYNMTEIENYAELIQIGEPDFIEVKAVTYCGKSDGSDLTMKNVPWHEEVKAFAAALCAETKGAYGLASEHSHSNCVLLARQEFHRDGKWFTWIDYPKFHQLMARFYEDPTQTFSTADYMAETPHWAMYDSKEEGFDPIETRFYRTKGGQIKEIPYEPTDSGCG